MPEFILDGKTGCFMNSNPEAVEMVTEIKLIDRTFCREYASEKFSRQKLIEVTPKFAVKF